jgi:HEPN domain-containing protein
MRERLFMIRYKEWINRAKGSLTISKIEKNIAAGDVFFYEDLCYQTQQAVEKAFKGFLIYFGVEPEFTHNIEALLEELEKVTIIPVHVREATDLTKFAVLTRYPGVYDEITKEMYKKAVKTAQECIEWVENTIKEIENIKNKTVEKIGIGKIFL